MLFRIVEVLISGSESQMGQCGFPRLQPNMRYPTHQTEACFHLRSLIPDPFYFTAVRRFCGLVPHVALCFRLETLPTLCQMLAVVSGTDSKMCST